MSLTGFRKNAWTKQKQQTNGNRAIWLVYQADTNALGFWLVKWTLVWRNFMLENFLEINPILRFDVILQHDLPSKQCHLHIRILFGRKTKRPCFEFFIHWLIKQVTNTYRNHFSTSYENRSKWSRVCKICPPLEVHWFLSKYWINKAWGSFHLVARFTMRCQSSPWIFGPVRVPVWVIFQRFSLIGSLLLVFVLLPLTNVSIQLYQNITHTGLALFMFPRSANPNMSTAYCRSY